MLGAEVRTKNTTRGVGTGASTTAETIEDEYAAGILVDCSIKLQSKDTKLSNGSE